MNCNGKSEEHSMKGKTLRTTNFGNKIVRERECGKCGGRFESLEMPVSAFDKLKNENDAKMRAINAENWDLKSGINYYKTNIVHFLDSLESLKSAVKEDQ